MTTPTIESLLVKAKPAINSSTGTLDELMVGYLGSSTATRDNFNRNLTVYLDGTARSAVNTWESMSVFLGYMYYLERSGINALSLAGCTRDEVEQIMSAFALLYLKIQTIANNKQPQTITRQLYDKIAQHDF